MDNTFSFLGGAAIFLAGLFSSNYFQYRSNQVASINDHLSDIKELEELAIKYWLHEDLEDSQNLSQESVESFTH